MAIGSSFREYKKYTTGPKGTKEILTNLANIKRSDRVDIKYTQQTTILLVRR